MAGKSQTQPHKDVSATLTQLANQRVPKAVLAIKRLGNLTRYKPTPAQLDKVYTAVEGELSRLKAHYIRYKEKGDERPEQVTFQL